MNKILNMRFRNKIIILFISVLLLNSVISGTLYYNYAFKDTLKNYYDSSEDMVSQMKLHLKNETKSITKRVYALYNNMIFYTPLENFLINPETNSFPELLGNISDMIAEIIKGNAYIHSMSIHTPYWVFEDFTRIKRHEYVFEDSDMYQHFQENPYDTIEWFPALKSPIFTGDDMVIPVVYRFRISRRDIYIVISISQDEIQEYLEDTYSSYDKIFIADKNGDNILNTGDDEKEILGYFANEELGRKHAICKEVEYRGEKYLATYTNMEGTGWQICALKSAESLVGNLNSLRYFMILIIGICALVSILLIVLLAYKLTSPLGRLSAIMKRVTQEDFKTHFDYPYKDEIGTLASSFNYMTSKINQLITDLNYNIEALKEEKETVKLIQKQKRKAELKALQAQINPHFLYNTLNAITWQAADQGANEISIMSNSLGKFFRISLSRGREIITIGEELEHVKSYLSIQKIRYSNLINFDINVPDDVKDLYIIKLVLQPLVENAIYHGIKKSKSAGNIWISIKRIFLDTGIQALAIIVEDDGIGIEEEKLKSLNEDLRSGVISRESGYGIFNVNERIRLYYGDQYGLSLESQFKAGTKATIIVPIQTMEVD